jgi:uncharacterized protein GlcG (DUF336 family)
MTRTALSRIALACLLALLHGCGGGGGGDAIGCTSNCGPVPPGPPPPAPTAALTVADVQQVIRQAVGEAQARSARATVAVVDRSGNVLAVFRMTGAATTFRITSGRGVGGGLEDVDVLPDGFAAIAKALTGAYLSSGGNAFSTRTAGQIIQQNFNPGELSQPSGPLFGVQFSQFSCSDVMRRESDGQAGPKRSPLGLAADPGGLPLYKGGRVVGGVGVIADGLYSLDLNVTNFDSDLDELIAVAGGTGFAAPEDRRADRLTADGRTLRYTDSETLASSPASAPAFAALPGTLIAVPGYAPAAVQAGTTYGTAASGVRADAGFFADLGGHVFVDGANANRFPAIAGTDGGLTQAEVIEVMRSALQVANRARAQIRRPLGSAAQVNIAVVDSQGVLLGLVASPDAPLFGADVSVQKARSAAFLSRTDAGAQLLALPPANYLSPPAVSPIGDYVTALRAFLADPTALANGVAFSNRAIGNLARPTFPDGIDGISGSGSGPLSRPLAAWSPFNTGLQLDLSYNAVVAAAGGDLSFGCTGLAGLRNGLQVFPGSVPVYRGDVLVGAIGVSGDGVDQDDMIAFLGLANAGAVLGNGIGNAPAARRADTLVPQGARLRYVQCPQTPFNDSTEQNVCAGL